MLPESNVASFLEAINDVERTIKFTMEKENDESIAFLDVKVKREELGKYSTSLYQKPTNTDRLLQFDSHHPVCQKRGVVKSMMHRALSISSKSSERKREMENLRMSLRTNGYPRHFIRQCAPSKQTRQQSEHQNRKRISLPYVGGISEKIGRCLRQVNIDIGYKPTRKISNMLPRPKDPVDQLDKCGVVYNIPCHDCPLTYVGQTKNSLRTRLGQHRTALSHMQPEKSALAEHALTEHHSIDWGKATVLSQETNWRKRLFLESFHSQRKAPVLNRCDLFIPSAYLNFINEH